LTQPQDTLLKESFGSVNRRTELLVLDGRGTQRREGYRRDFATEGEAYEFLFSLKGKPVAVQVQAGMLTPAADFAGIGLVFAAALMESETTQLAPAKAMQIALPA
jgi:hypothetical protein